MSENANKNANLLIFVSKQVCVNLFIWRGSDLDKFVLEAFHKAVAKRSGSAVVDASVEWEQLHDSESGNPFWHI